MSNYLAKIGIEMHCEISETKSKVFSPASNSYTEIPNSNVRPLDMGFPGTLPVVNKEAVRLSLMASMALNCKIPEYLELDRKNYYYPDLPKGYQITQESNPIGVNGEIIFEVNGEEKKCRINNIHLEEDTASLDHFYSTSNIDYNRCGVPLLELVTEPDLHSADEAVAFVEAVRSIYRYANISEADTRKGQIRCDVNVSIMDANLDENDPKNWGTKIEMKNVNSIGGIRDCINYEIKRQIELKENGQYDKMEQETRRWDEESCSTVFMRSKADAIDYKYFNEPNIPRVKLDNEWLLEIKESIPKLALERKKIYIDEYGLSNYDASVLVKEKDISDYYEECLKLGIDPKIACNWVTVNIIGELNKDNSSIKDFYITPKMLKQIIDELNKGNISSKQAKEIFSKSLEEKKEPKNFISNDNQQISDENELSKIIIDILDNSPTQIEQYKNGRDNLFDYFVGQVMKNTRGKANPVMTKEILNKELNKR